MCKWFKDELDQGGCRASCLCSYCDNHSSCTNIFGPCYGGQFEGIEECNDYREIRKAWFTKDGSTHVRATKMRHAFEITIENGEVLKGKRGHYLVESEDLPVVQWVVPKKEFESTYSIDQIGYLPHSWWTGKVFEE